VATLRFARDRRGYEHFYLIEPTGGRRSKGRHRILYWFRTPPGVKVGRSPFAEHVRRALEEQYPGVTFDWEGLIATPIPPPAADVERWRERRRAARAARQAVAAAEADAVPAGGEVEAAPPEAAAAGTGGPETSAGPAGSRRRRRRRRRGAKRSPAGSEASDPVAPEEFPGSEGEV
jgi:hypothetical protein